MTKRINQGLCQKRAMAGDLGEIQASAAPVNKPGPDRCRTGSDPLTQNLNYSGLFIGVLNGLEHYSLEYFASMWDSRHCDSNFPMKTWAPPVAASYVNFFIYRSVPSFRSGFELTDMVFESSFTCQIIENLFHCTNLL
jgi:hypothetical protein